MRLFGNARPLPEYGSVTLESIARGIERIEKKTDDLADSVQVVQRAVDVLTTKQSSSETDIKRAFDTITSNDIKAQTMGAELAARFEKRATELAAVSSAHDEVLDGLKSKTYWVMGVGAGFGVLGAVVVALLQYIAFETVGNIKADIAKIQVESKDTIQQMKTDIQTRSTIGETDRRDLREKLRDLERLNGIKP